MRLRLADRRIWGLHLGLIAVLFLLQFVLPDYHHTNVARILVLATYAMGYNLLVGYTGLLSLGHAMFFAAGLYGAGLSIYYFDLHPVLGFLLGSAAALVFAIAVGLIALRTTGVAFMIVTMMFAQAFYLATLYFNSITRGDEGLVLAPEARRFAFFGLDFDLAEPVTRYNMALALFVGGLIVCLMLVRSPVGRVMVAIRENEERTRMLGYNARDYKLLALSLSGLLSGAAGAAYVLLFAYMGSTFAGIQYSILPLLWVLLGGVGTVVGPLIGTLLMFYLIDKTSEVMSSYLIVVGAVLVLLVLFFPKGIAGTLRARYARWMP
ncbi:MAG: branched-chain amino acid ABC transporter permease [Rhodospirillaceae bacterium]|nr:branched-chain amino acid ABC transporter permease [Rhodospirillaceae bacterium]